MKHTRRSISWCQSLVFLFFIFVLFACSRRHLSPETKTQLPVQLLALMKLRELTFEQLQAHEFNVRTVEYLKDTVTKQRMNHEYIYDQELFRTYEFVKGKVLVISESNEQGRIDPQPNSLTRILKILGREDLNLPSSGGNENREYIYGAFGIAVVGNSKNDRLIRFSVFSPMTANKYKNLIWVDPSYYNEMDLQ